MCASETYQDSVCRRYAERIARVRPAAVAVAAAGAVTADTVVAMSALQHQKQIGRPALALLCQRSSRWRRM